MLTKLANLCNNLRHGNHTNKLTQWGVDRLKFQLASHPTISCLERFSIECRKSKNQNNHDCQSKGRKIPLRANENSTWKQANCLKRGKLHLYCIFIASYWLREWREFSGPITERRARMGCTHNQRETSPINVQSGETLGILQPVLRLRSCYC